MVIENTAQAEFQQGSGTQTVSSNTVTLRVNEVLDVAVTSLQSGPVSSESATATLGFEVTNTGNGPEAFRLSVAPEVPGNDFLLSVQSIAIDANGNGIFDPGIDTVLASGALTEMLAADARITVLVNVTLPANATNDQLSNVQLSATAATGSGAAGTVYAAAGQDGTDAIVGSSTATAPALAGVQAALLGVSLVKSAQVVDPSGGTEPTRLSIITYTIRAEVTGNGVVQDLVVSDAIPAGTAYRPGSLTLNGAPLTDAADADPGTFAPSGAQVDLGDVAAGTANTIRFQVTIE